MNIDVDHNIDEVARWMRWVFADQLPFATSRAINRVAILAQQHQREHQEEVFNVTDREWTEKAVKISPFSNKRTLEAKIQILPPGGRRRASILTKFEEDRWKVPYRRRTLWVPHENILGADERVTEGWRPKDLGLRVWKRGPKAKILRGRKNTFAILYHQAEIGFISGKATMGFIFERDEDELVLLYTRLPRVAIDPVLEFEDNVARVVRENFDRLWVEEFTNAIRTARPGRVTPGARRMATLLAAAT